MRFLITVETTSHQIEKYELYIEPKDISFENLLVGRPLWNCFVKVNDQNDVWMRCESEKNLKQLMSYMVFEQNEIIIIFRESKESPNQTPDSTHQNSINEAFSSLNIKESFNNSKIIPTNIVKVIEITFNTLTNTFVPFTRELICIDPESCLSLLCDDKIHCIKVDSEALLKYITHQVFDLVHPYEVVIDCFVDEDKFRVALTKEVWSKVLTRGHQKSSIFIDFILNSYGLLFKLDFELQSLHNSRELWMKIKFFHYDLMHFSNTFSQYRLNIDPGISFFLTSAYFNDIERNYILSFPTSSGITFECYMQMIQNKKIKDPSSLLYFCASHDLAPVVAKVFHIKKNYDQEKVFQEAFKKFEKETKKLIK